MMADDRNEPPPDTDLLWGDREISSADARLEPTDAGLARSVPPASADARPPAGAPAHREQPDDPTAADESKRRSGSFLRELPFLLLIAFLLAFLLRTFVLQVFYIPSASMEPTLMVDDRMVVEKVTYRFREPQRGEIVVFEGETTSVPAAEVGPVAAVVRGVGQFLGIVPASAKDFVKRVIGLPGDEVLIDDDGVVFVNGEALDEPYVQPQRSGYGPIVVPEDSYFFLGDNRANSSDSRASLGFVPREHIVGRAVVIIWPLDHTGLLTGTHHEIPDLGRAPPAEDIPEPVPAAP